MEKMQIKQLWIPVLAGLSTQENFVKARHTNSFWMHNYQKGMQK